jgi:sialidase-1
MKFKLKEKRIAVLALLVVTIFTLNCNAAIAKKTIKWNGYQKQVFQVDGRQCHIVWPKEALNGKPWIWRARFPTYHTEMDIILLKKGVAVAYMDVAKLFGSPKAVKHWDEFYKYMIKEGFAKRPALEAVSRGGLIAYNWAKKNPEKVACIYADSPVSDLKSWPGNKNLNPTWKEAMLAYNMSDEQLINFSDNPIDNLAALAKAKVPILHMVNPADKIVPIKDNTMKLVSRYIEHGGIATVYSNTKGPVKSSGHHFKIEDVGYGADFVLTNLKKSNPALRSFFSVRDNLKNSQLVFEQSKKGRVAYLGGSITTMSWPNMVSDYIKKRFPEAQIDIVNAGIPSMGTTPHSFRLTKDVFSKGKVDLLFVEAAVNDSSNGRTPTEMLRGMEGVIRHARSINPEIDIVMMHFVDPAKMASYNKGSVPVVIAQHEKVARHYNVNSLNLALEVTERINGGEFTWGKDFKDLHPAPFGQKLYANSISNMLDSIWHNSLHSDDKLKVKQLPAPLDPQSYDKGEFIAIQNAKLGGDWKIDERWHPKTGSTRKGFVNIPMLICERPGDALTLEFSGRAIGLIITAGYDAGVVEYSIDNVPWQKKDMFTRWSSGLHLPWVLMLDADLKPGKHVLKLRVSSEKNKNSQGNACRIAMFAVNR